MARHIFIFTILISGLLAKQINFDPNEIDEGIDKKIIHEKIIEKCTQEESVQLDNMRLTEIPDGLIKSTAIKSLSIKNNLITKVPQNIFKDIPNLQCLNLAGNRIPFEKLLNFQHDGLKTLIISHQKETRNFEQFDVLNGSNVLNDANINLKLETSTSYFPQLENLHLDGVDFENFDDFFNQSFPRLTSLFLMENHLRFVKSNILSVLPYSLRNLHLEKNDIEKLHLDYTINLEALYLDENPLRTLRIDFPSSGLKMLSLSKCELRNLGTDMLLSGISGLTTLDLSDNLISKIDAYTFQDTPFLKTLSLSRNSLSVFPLLHHLQQLNSLSLSYNLIENIREAIALPSLKRLSLRHNRISFIDVTAFSQLQLLEDLDLSENKLQSLPLDWSIELKNLQYLNLKANQFARIADMSVTSLLNLRELYIKYNSITTIDQSSLQLIPSECSVYVC